MIDTSETTSETTSGLKRMIEQPVDENMIRLLARISELEDQVDQLKQVVVVENAEFLARQHMLQCWIKEQRAINRRSHELHRWYEAYEKQPTEAERDRLVDAYDDFKRRADVLTKLLADYERLSDLSAFAKF